MNTGHLKWFKLDFFILNIIIFVISAHIWVVKVQLQNNTMTFFIAEKEEWVQHKTKGFWITKKSVLSIGMSNP